MDNITHGLLGLTIGLMRRREQGPGSSIPGLPPSQTDRGVMWGAVLAAELPDIDVFFGSKPLDEYLYHRGLTHSLLFAPVIAAVSTGLVRLVWRQARVRTIYRYSLISVLFAHLINDWMTGWGTRLLLPFAQARLGLDWVPIVDLLYTLPLLLAVLVALFRPHLRRKAASAVLAYLLFYTVGYRGLSSALAKAQVQHLYAALPVAQMRVAPELLNPLRWQYTVDLGDRFEQGTVYAWGGARQTRSVAKLPEDQVIRAVRTAPELKPFFDQFAYVNITYSRTETGYLINLGDVRYEFGGRGMGQQVLVSSDLRIERILTR